MKANDEQTANAVPFHHYEQTVVSKIHHFYISNPVGEPSDYVDMVHYIQTAGSEDVIYLHLNFTGGNLAAGVQLINAMQNTHAHVVVSVEGEAHSLGTLLFLVADEFIVHDNCMMMFHNFSSATFGKGHEQQSQLAAIIRWFETLSRKIYIPFLSETEYDRILKGEDIWMHSEEIRTRLEHMVIAKNEESKKETKTKPAKKAKK